LRRTLAFDGFISFGSSSAGRVFHFSPQDISLLQTHQKMQGSDPAAMLRHFADATEIALAAERRRLEASRARADAAAAVLADAVALYAEWRTSQQEDQIRHSAGNPRRA
jgi:hypothetical protein